MPTATEQVELTPTGETGRPKTPARIPVLDGVRGLAILLVILWHYVGGQLDATQGAILNFIRQLVGICWSGVDLFFVLSGFLLGGILIENRSSANYYKTFYIRRACRIFPLYYAWILIVAVAWWWLKEGKLAALFNDIGPVWPYLTYVQNITQIFAKGDGGWVLGVTWSLAVEEQFYLILPLLIRAIAPQKLCYWLVLLIASATVFRLAMWYFGPRQGWAGYVILPCRWDSLFIGVLGAWSVRQPQFMNKVQKNYLFLCGLMIVIAAGITILRVVKQGNPIYLGTHLIGFLWLAVFYLGLILLALSRKPNWLSTLCTMKWLCFLGTISYGLYILHQPISSLMHLLIGNTHPMMRNDRDVAATAGALASCVLIAWLSWRFFESKLVRWGRKYEY